MFITAKMMHSLFSSRDLSAKPINAKWPKVYDSVDLFYMVRGKPVESVI